MKKHFLTVRVPLLSAVYAGTPTPIEGWEIKKFRSIRTVDGVPSSERLAIVPVIGNSLSGTRIFDGDLLVFKLTSEPRAGKVHIFQTPHGLTAKFFSINDDGETITLFGSNPDYKSQVWKIEEIKLVGVVLRVERDL